MKYVGFVLGAGGCGKTTFCRQMKESYGASLINLDPSQKTDYDLDLTDYIGIEEIMENFDFGPNGALFFALKEMIDNIEDFPINDLNDMIFIDCPGQIELFLHSDIIEKLIKEFENTSKIIIIYIIDGTVFSNDSKYLYSMFTQAISLGRFEIPIINVVTKLDLLDRDLQENLHDNEWIYDHFTNITEKMYGKQQDLLELSESEDIVKKTENLKISSCSEIHTYDEYKRLVKAMAEYISYNGFLNSIPVNWNDNEDIKSLNIHLNFLFDRYNDLDPKENIK